MSHPLDPLTAEEIRRAAAILRRDRGVGERWRFASIELREPSKEAVRELAHADRVDRQADVICWNRDDGQAYKALVSLAGDRVAGWEARDGQPSMTVDEYHECDEILRRDPRVIEALARRGITDMDRVLIDTWAYGAHLVPEAHRAGRVGWADVWYRKQEGSSPYANPVTGLHLVVDLNRMELLEVEDVHRVDEPRTMGEYVPHLVPGQRPRVDLKPLEIVQPEGVSFTLEGRLLRWQKWSLRSASTTARAWSCTPSATRTPASCAPWPTGCRSPRWWSPTAIPPPTTTAARPSTSASGGWAS